MIVIDEKLLDRFRGSGICECCRRWSSRREPHHLLAKGLGGGWRLDVAINILSLCSAMSGGLDCHDKHHNGDGASREKLLGIISRRENREPQEIMAELRRLQQLPKWSVI